MKHDTNLPKKGMGLLLKIAGTFSILLLLSILALTVLSVVELRKSNYSVAEKMGKDKLHGDIVSFQWRVAQTYGALSLKNGDLVDEKGNSLKGNYDLVDLLHDSLSVQATIFMHENNDYRRIATSIIDNSGKRAVDTFLGKNSAAFSSIQAGRDYFGEAVILGKNYLTAYRPIIEKDSKNVIGILFIGIEMSEINNIIEESINKLGRSIIFLAVVNLAISIFATVIICRIILLKPILAVKDMLKVMGEGDLTRRLSIKTKDEIGDMAHNVNITVDKIKNLVTTIKRQTGALSDIGTDLSSNMIETAAAINQITANIQSIKGRVINQSASVTETNATMEQVTVNLNKLNNHIESQSANITQASSAIEQMIANIQSVTNTLVKNSSNVKTLQEASEVGRSGLQDVAADIQDIVRESEGLLEINSVMQNIASQTNLLSMNAAIEAAHAGDAGKGFAVVADEIRKLAENSEEQSKTIGAVLNKIKGSIDKITSLTQNVLDKFEAIDSSVKTVSEQEESIRNAMEEQGTGSGQILQGLGNVNDITSQVKYSSNEMLEGSQEVIHESNNLEMMTQEITGGMNEMASGAEEINVAINHVKDICNKNRENIELLVQEVSRFKV